jgi:hypothetical protein
MFTIDKRKRNDGGVSESIGFLLIFTMVIAGIGLVTLYGYPLLLQQQVSTDEKSMEQNMIVLQNDMKSLAYKTVPYQETSLKVGSGSLTVYNSSSDVSQLAIYANGNPLISVKPGDLRYVSTDAQTGISLQNGAVVSRNLLQNGSVMLAEPRWFYDSVTNTWVINIISVNSTDVLARAGIGTVQMKLGETYYSETTVPNGNTISLEYTIDPNQDYSVAWTNYFDSTLANPALTNPWVRTASVSPITYVLNAGANPVTLVIKKYDVVITSV